MQPTALDFEIIRALAPLQQNYFLVDSVDVLADSPLVNGFVFAVPWFLYWHFAEGGKRWLAQYLLMTSAIATGMGIMASLLLQQFCTWPPPADHPVLYYRFRHQYLEQKGFDFFVYMVTAFCGPLQDFCRGSLPQRHPGRPADWVVFVLASTAFGREDSSSGNSSWLFLGCVAYPLVSVSV